MSLFTTIGRVADGMALVASQDDNSAYGNSEEIRDLKSQAKKLLKSFKPNSPAKCTIDASKDYHFCYIIEQGVCYLTLAEKSYPKKLAFQFLEAVSREFIDAHQHEVAKFSRPFAAVSFDPKLNRLRKEFLDPRSPKNMQRLNEDLTEIQLIMRTNIQDVLQRGERLDAVQSMSSNLLSESKRFESAAKTANYQAFWKTWTPVLVVVLVVMLIVYFRFFRGESVPATS